MFSLCKPVSNKKRFSPNRKLNDEFSFTLYPNAFSLKKEEWKAVTGGNTTFLEPEYLSILEACSNTRLLSRYVIVYKNGKPCGVLYFQIIDFQAGIFGDLLSTQVESIRSTRLKLFENYIGSNKEEILMRLFTCGNNVVSGDYGFRFTPQVNEKAAHNIVLEIIDVIAKEEKMRGTISAVLLKDFEEKLKPADLFDEEKYTDFLVEPNMIIDLPKGVKTLNDYIQLFSKKYRNRAKSILKSAAPLQSQALSREEIATYEKEIFALYESVYEKAKFKLLKLPVNYFSSVKNCFAESFFIHGFFKDGKLIAFTSYFLLDENTFEAHYIGLDYSLNQDYDLYQNILYKNIECALQHKRTRINLGRTAAEIKTTVGAKAVDLTCYIKPQNTISKLILKPFISFLQPAEWTARNPFKEETVTG